MIRLDSLDVTLDTGTLPSVNRDRLIHRETVDGETGEMQEGWYTSETGLHGFTGVAATPFTVSLRLTAQTMGNRYSDGLSLETLDELCDRLNRTGLIELTPADLLGGTVRRADPFADVPTADVGDVPGALRLIGRTLPGAEIKGRGDGVTLYRRLPDREGLLRAYPKGRQLATAKHAEFRTLYPAAVAGLAGHHRAEIAAQTYHASRRLAAMPTGRPTVADVLGSDRQPVADALDAMLSTWTRRRRALHSLPSVPDSLDALLSQPSASPSADALALLAALVADLTGGDYDAATAAVRARYGQNNAHRLYPALRSACEAYGRPADARAHAEAVDVLRLVSDRVRAREAA